MSQSDKDKIYGVTAQDWLDKWDKGETVWTVEMGGLGPGYEQAIQITAVEMVRYLVGLGDSLDWEEVKNDKEVWENLRTSMDEYVFCEEPTKNLGLSGAQHGVALNLACNLVRQGPAKALSDPAVKERLIQCSKNFPSA